MTHVHQEIATLTEKCHLMIDTHLSLFLETEKLNIGIDLSPKSNYL